MSQKANAILIPGSENETFSRLRTALERQGISTSTASNPQEALRQLLNNEGELVVFTDATTLAGNWEKALRPFERANIPVIVVSRTVDLNLYIDVLDKGAADFIVPPFSTSELSYVVHNALSHANTSGGKVDHVCA